MCISRKLINILVNQLTISNRYQFTSYSKLLKFMVLHATYIYLQSTVLSPKAWNSMSIHTYFIMDAVIKECYKP